MKRELLPTIEQVAEVVRRVDLAPLKNRLVGKQLLGLEHCLIEVLGSLVERHSLAMACAGDTARYAMEARDRDAFLDAYNEYQRERGAGATDYANFSPTGRYFQALLDRLNDAEDKQIRQDRPSTVGHARMLAALIVRQLETMTAYYLGRNEKLDKLWDHWMSRPVGTAATEGVVK